MALICVCIVQTDLCILKMYKLFDIMLAVFILLSILFSSVSEEDEILLDLWDQGLDNDITTFQDRSQGTGMLSLLIMSPVIWKA